MEIVTQEWFVFAEQFPPAGCSVIPDLPSAEHGDLSSLILPTVIR